LWKFIAARYKNNHSIMFGLMNEPLCGNSLVDSYWSKHIGHNYSSYMEQVVDGIRDTGAKQIIFIDKPFIWFLRNVHPVNRENIVWEGHMYVTQRRDMDRWKGNISSYVQRFVGDFNKPLFIGEYGIDPYDLVKPEQMYENNWKTIISDEVVYLDTKPIVGRQWHHWGALDGEFSDNEYDYFTEEESEYILQTVLG